MPELTIRFSDNEVLQGEAEDVDLENPDFHVMVGGGSNNESAWVPLAAVKKITLGTGPADEHAADANKMVAVRFRDGEVMRGFLNGSLRRHRYGLTMSLYSPDKASMDSVGVPYSALKAVFYLKQWDSRPPGYRVGGEKAAPLLNLLSDVREITRMYQAGSITREEFLAHRRTLLEKF